MSNGFNLGVLQHIKEVAKTATPQYKVEPYGFTASCILAHTPGSIKNDTYDGHKQTVKIKSRKRVLPSQVSDEASCEITTVPAYTEETVSVAGFRQHAFHIEDEVVAQYEKYASAMQSGQTTPATSIMAEFLEEVVVSASAIISAVNADLVALAVANMGVNRSTGLATATAINIAKSTSTNSLTDGPTRILTDFRLNGMKGKPVVIGSGLFNAWIMQQQAKVSNQAGIDTRIQAGGFDFFYDNDWATATGADTIGVYERNAIQLVEYLEYQGWKAGPKPGASFFGTITLPMTTYVGTQEVLVPIKFDFQLRYNDCDATFVVGESEVPLKKGYNMIISKRFGLWTIPADAYQVGDVLEGNRGSLLYDITNDCDSCDNAGY